MPSMSLHAVYKQFLTAPNPSLLADDATLHYVATTTSYKGAAEILKHLEAQGKQIKTNKVDTLDVVEGHDALAVEIDTALEFISGGGSYLPGLDDNFLTDRKVNFPVAHIVHFGPDGKITQIRQRWDQGSLLKQLDVIGKSGRNWPLRDGADQVGHIVAALKGVVHETAPPSTAAAAAADRPASHSHSRDPSTIFAPVQGAEEGFGSVISPKAGARPRQRGFAEILGDEPDEQVVSQGVGHERPESPTKAIAPKSGAGKNYGPNRLFEDEGKTAAEAPAGSTTTTTTSTQQDGSSDRVVRPHSKKYDHFDLGDGGDDPSRPADGTPNKTKHNSQWSFDDFYTPHQAERGKGVPKGHQAIRHWGNEGDEVEETPMRQPQLPKPRRDAETHFELKDDGTPQGEPRTTRPRGATHNARLGLYENNVTSASAADEAASAEPEGQALGNITNTSLKDRSRDFGAHFAIQDESPAHDPQSRPKISEDRKKAVKMMENNWSMYDSSPVQKENHPGIPGLSKGGDDRGINVGGDGMGGAKGASRNWLYGGDDENKPAKAAPARKQANARSVDWDF